jgi:hypothetical protein
MKKRQLFVTGILALALVFGLVLAGCDNGSTDSDSDPVWKNVTDDYLIGDYNTTGLAVSSARQLGKTIEIKVTGSIADTNQGKFVDGTEGDINTWYGICAGTEKDYALISIVGVYEVELTSGDGHKKNFATLTYLPLATWYDGDPDQGKFFTDRSNGIIRYTGSESGSTDIPYNETSDNSHFGDTQFTFMLYKNASSKVIIVKFDGAGGKDHPDGKIFKIDYSTVEWLAP